MDYTFSTTPATFAADLATAVADQHIPDPVQTAIKSGWAATDQTKPTYQIDAATGDFWTVVRVAAVLEA
jgi:hypothetical protein